MPSFSGKPKQVFSGLGIGWNKKAGRYQARRDMPELGLKKGAFVKNTRVVSALEKYRDITQKDMKQAAQDLKEKKIGFREFERGMRRLIRENERAAAMIGAGGAQRFNKNKNFERELEQNIRVQFEYLSKYVADMRDKGRDNMTARDINRAGMYSLTSHKTMYQMMRSALQNDADDMGMKLCEKRVLGDAEHCPDCVGYASACWQEAGVLPEPTENSQCGANCRCNKRFTFLPINTDCEDIPCSDDGNAGEIQQQDKDSNVTDLSDDSRVSESEDNGSS